MITVNVEIRYANTMVGAKEVKRVTKEDIISDLVTVVLEALEPNCKEITKRPFFISTSREWKRLPKKIYKFKDEEGHPEGICVVTKRQINCPEARFVPFFVFFPENSEIPHYIVSLAPTMSDLT